MSKVTELALGQRAYYSAKSQVHLIMTTATSICALVVLWRARSYVCTLALRGSKERMSTVTPHITSNT